MTELDKDLQFAEAQRPLTIAGNAVPIALFGALDPGSPRVLAGESALSWPSTPDPVLGGSLVNTFNLRAIMDWARGRAVYANFRLNTAFAGDAANFLRFCIAVDSVAAFTNVLSGYRIVTAGHSIVTAGLGAGAVGSVMQLALPPLSDWTRSLAAAPDYNGMQFLALGFEYGVPTTDWTAGLLDAWLTLNPIPGRPTAPTSGY